MAYTKPKSNPYVESMREHLDEEKREAENGIRTGEFYRSEGKLIGVDEYAPVPGVEDPKISHTLNYIDMFVLQSIEKLHPNVNDSQFIAFVGNRGTGKSTNTFTFGHAIAKKIREMNPERIQKGLKPYPKIKVSVDNIFFDAKDVLEAVKTKSNTVLFLEELGVSAYSRNFMHDQNKLLNLAFQMFRFKNIIIIANFQAMTHIDNHLRSQLDLVFWCASRTKHGANGEPYSTKTVKPLYVSTRPFGDPWITPYMKLKRGAANLEQIGWIPLPQRNVLFDRYGVPDGFMEAYEKRKNEYFMTIGKEEKKAAREEKENKINGKTAAMHKAVASIWCKTELEKIQNGESMASRAKANGIGESTYKARMKTIAESMPPT
ncbi:hypothetical protein MSSAC_1537 [Methanosarcina siciliae C2J]|uniref:ATPase AAA-type core domain-containing protein n=1 Tax=Methanosarcina siciliae C2J TaxID=1434118 RepID=A0A0E3PLF5_9EURY|nr:AAA family ATPase [Methanosarcina siciliae]AKB36127.1 hypothetical protein MSSAC_1537 [Methanosarcina siciliae C2J]